MADLNESLLIDLIDRVYGAALEPTEWESVSRALGDAFDAPFSWVFGFDSVRSQVLYAHAWGLPDEEVARYESTYAALDVRMPAALRAPVGSVVTDESLIDRTVYRSSTIYNEFLRPLGLDHLMAVLPENSSGAHMIVSMNRAEPFGALEQKFLGRLVPHIQRAAQMSSKLVTAANAEHLSQDLMSRLPFGVITLGSGGRILDSNPLAAHWLSESTVLLQMDGLLKAAHRGANDELQHALATAERFTRRRANVELDPVVTIPCVTGAPLRLLLSPFDAVRLGFGATAPLLVAFIFSSDPGTAIDPSLLSRVYGFSAGEARIAAKLGDGWTPAEIAQRFSLSIDTVRTHIKRLLSKTQCHSQTALVREILLGPATWRL